MMVEKEFRPRLTNDMLLLLCRAIVTELQRLLPLLDEAKKITAEKIHAGEDYEPFIQKQLELDNAIRILEEMELQFQRLLEGKTKGRRMWVRPWRSRRWNRPRKE